MVAKHLPQSENFLAQSENIIRTAVLVLDQSNTLSFAAAVDPMRAANRQAGRALFEWQFVTPTDADVHLTSGLRVPAQPVARLDHCDMLVIVAGFDVEAQTTPALCASVARLGRRAAKLAGVDGGPWVLAQSGLLDGQRATTHWEDLEAFSRRFTRVETVNARYLMSGNIMTSAGAAPTIDMMLALIEDTHSPALARKVAGSFVLDHQRDPLRPQMRRPMAQRGSRLTARAHELMENALDTPMPLSVIAKELGISPRVLQLRFRAHLGTTAQQYYLSLRLAEAQRLVMNTSQSLHDIAFATGFTSQSSFARAYARAFGTGARAHRAQTRAPQ